MDLGNGEFEDWEVLHQSGDSGNQSESIEDVRALEGIEGESEGIIRSNYFSFDPQNNYARTVTRGDLSEESSVESDNPSWVDPGSETLCPRKELRVFWSDSSSDRSDDLKFNESDKKDELALVENAKIEAGLGTEEIAAESENSEKFWSDSGGIGSLPMKLADFVENFEMGIGGNANSGDGSDPLGEKRQVDNSMEGGEQPGEHENVVIEALKSGSEQEKRTVVWWKLPLEFLNYCVFKVSPVWTFSVAAAVVGFVILGRRLYKMKQKSRSLQLKVTVDDKKVSQFMSRAARLNEAFSVVKRVPIIRPTLPAAGVSHWPAMSLR